jgi:hypothetical protein
MFPLTQRILGFAPWASEDVVGEVEHHSLHPPATQSARSTATTPFDYHERKKHPGAYSEMTNANLIAVAPHEEQVALARA